MKDFQIIKKYRATFEKKSKCLAYSLIYAFSVQRIRLCVCEVLGQIRYAVEKTRTISWLHILVVQVYEVLALETKCEVSGFAKRGHLYSR